MRDTISLFEDDEPTSSNASKPTQNPHPTVRSNVGSSRRAARARPDGGLPPVIAESRVVTLAAQSQSRQWLYLGLAVITVLCALDVVGGLLAGERYGANISGTLALAPALAAVGGSRRQTAAVGALAITAACALAIWDQVPVVTGIVRVLVTVAAAVVAYVIGVTRQRQDETIRDRDLASRTLQAAMMTKLPSVPPLDLHSRYLPASAGNQVGGDWYDALVDRHGRIVLVVGDVVGHDLKAAAIMGQLRAIVRSYAVEGTPSPAQLLQRVDEAMAGLDIDTLATVIVMVLEQDLDETGAATLTWTSAGHPPPIIIDGDDTAVCSAEPFEIDPDPMIGIDPATTRHDHTVHVPAGAALLIYTDGLIERRGEHPDTGLERLLTTARAHCERPISELLDNVLTDALPHDHEDDVALLGLRLHTLNQPATGRSATRH